MIHALIFAGGIGSRMHTAALPKQFLLVHGRPIIVHTIERFSMTDSIDNIVVVCTPGWVEYMRDLVARFSLDKVSQIVEGGSTAVESQRLGLISLVESGADESDIVLIHDGVRPLVDEETILDCVTAVEKYGSAVTIAPAIETIAFLDEEGYINSTTKRSDCVLARAPQAFRLGDICRVQERAREEGGDFVDSATMMTHYGYRVHAVQGKPENIKVTTPLDYFMMRALLDARESEQIGRL